MQGIKTNKRTVSHAMHICSAHLHQLNISAAAHIISHSLFFIRPLTSHSTLAFLYNTSAVRASSTESWLPVWIVMPNTVLAKTFKERGRLSVIGVATDMWGENEGRKKKNANRERTCTRNTHVNVSIG